MDQNGISNHLNGSVSSQPNGLCNVQPNGLSNVQSNGLNNVSSQPNSLSNGISSQPNGQANGHAGRPHSANGIEKKLAVLKPEPRKVVHPEKEEVPFMIELLCHLSYLLVILFGHLRDFLRNVGLEKRRGASEKNREGYVQLYNNFESFYTRNIYRRISHGWNLPICSVPAAKITVIDRASDDNNWSFKYLDTRTEAINLGSYNYLGYSSNTGPITDTVEESIKRYGIGVSSTKCELGRFEIQDLLERKVAEFLGVESAICFGMGFATNSTNIPSIGGKGCLILSDELNHASLVLGCRLSGSVVKVFKHNDMKNLESLLRYWIVKGQPKTHRPWKKIMIIVEGIYSMEGTIVKLPEVIALKKKYKAYVYLDEAHSIGAMGKRGRGVVDYYGCDPRDIDMYMGTFTKSFGAAGGYIAGSRELIDYIRCKSHSCFYAASISPPICQQIISVIDSLDTDEGKRRIETLARNTAYFRSNLIKRGFIIYGNEDSPVVPLLIYFPGKIVAFTSQALKMGVATIGAGFPATPLIESRVRFCISAAHTKEMLDQVIEVTDRIGDELAIKYSKKKLLSNAEIIY